MVAIPASSRSVTYAPVNSAGPFPLGFPVFDGSGADLRVRLDGENVVGWVLSGTLEPPLSWVDCSITFAEPVTGTLVIDGRRTPRRPGQYQEGRGIAARDSNAEWNILTAVQQEQRRDTDFVLSMAEDLDGAVQASQEAATTATGAADVATEKAGEAVDAAAAAVGAVAGRVAKAGDTMDPNADLIFQGAGGVDLGNGGKLRDLPSGRLADDEQPIWSGHFFPSLDKIMVTAGQGVDDAFSDEVVLQAAIDAAAVRGQIVQLSAGIWRLVSTLQMKSKVALVVPRGTVITTSNTAIGDTIQCNGISDFVIEGLTINGPSPPPYPGGTSNTSGISIYNTAQRGRVLGCVIRDYLGNGINMNAGNADIVVEHNLVENCRVGVSVFKGNQRAKVRGNTIAYCHDIGINVDDATTPDTAGTASPNHRTMIEGNHLLFVGYNAGANGIAVQGSYYTIVRGNSIQSCGKGPATWVSASGIAVNGGQANYNLSGYTEIHGNTVNDCTAAGVSIGSSESADVQGNQVLDNWQWPSALGGNLGEIEITSVGFGGGTIANASVLNNRIYLTKSGSSRSTHCIVNDGTRTRIGGNSYRNATPTETVQSSNQADWIGVDQLDSLPTNGVQGARVAMNRAAGSLHFHNGTSWQAA